MNNIIVQSTKWSGITEILSKLILPVINLFLARILAPEVFGVVATFTMVTTFAEIFTDAGFSKYLIQHEFQDEEDQELSTQTAFWTNIVFSCVIWGIVFLFRYPIASLVGSEGYETEIAVMSLTIPVVSFASIQLALYRRNFRFKQLLPIRIITCLVPLVVTLPLALILRNCWALIIGAIAKEIVNFSLLTIKSTWKPKFRYSFTKLKKMLSFSLIMMADTFVIWLTSYAGTFIIGTTLNKYYTGIYKTGISTISVYINIIYTITAPVLFAALSRAQNDDIECKHIYAQFQHYASLLLLPLGVGIFVFRDFVTGMLLGKQWGEASLLLGGMGCALSVTIVTAQYNSDYFRAKGKPYLSLSIQLIYAILMIIALSVFVTHSFEALCIARIVVAFAYALISCIAMNVFMKVSFVGIVKNLFWPGLASILMGFLGWFLCNLRKGMLWYVLFVLICIVFYGVVLLVIPYTRKELLSLPQIKKLTNRLKIMQHK